MKSCIINEKVRLKYSRLHFSLTFCCQQGHAILCNHFQLVTICNGFISIFFQALFHYASERNENYIDFLRIIVKKASSWRKSWFFFLQSNLIHGLQSNKQGGDLHDLRLVPKSVAMFWIVLNEWHILLVNLLQFIWETVCCDLLLIKQLQQVFSCVQRNIWNLHSFLQLN